MRDVCLATVFMKIAYLRYQWEGGALRKNLSSRRVNINDWSQSHEQPHLFILASGFNWCYAVKPQLLRLLGQ